MGPKPEEKLKRKMPAPSTTCPDARRPMNTHHKWKARASSGAREHARRSSAFSEAKLEKKPLKQNIP
ncbi:hypothetical protein Bca4012_051644 [Brassica carinata]